MRRDVSTRRSSASGAAWPSGSAGFHAARNPQPQGSLDVGNDAAARTLSESFSCQSIPVHRVGRSGRVSGYEEPPPRVASPGAIASAAGVGGGRSLGFDNQDRADLTVTLWSGKRIQFAAAETAK
jgi:hypothetical protein